MIKPTVRIVYFMLCYVRVTICSWTVSVAHVSGMRYYVTYILWGLINAPVHSINYRPFEHRIAIQWIQYLIAHCIIHI
jgi:hypothetical protein